MSQNRSEIRGLLRKHRIEPDKSMGQHFLADRNLVAKLVDLAGDPSHRALEIGPGTGTITKALAESGFVVVAYEIDPRFRPLLEESLEGLEVEVRYQDAAGADLSEMGPGTNWVLVANLPFNVGPSMLIDLLASAAGLSRCVVVTQREVAERLTAGPGSKKYGLPSVAVALYGRSRLEFRIPPQVFLPVPRVESAALTIQRVAIPTSSRRLATRIASSAFGQRRKMLRSSLKGVLPSPVEAVLEAVGIDPGLRAEDIPPPDYLRIAESLDEGGEK